MRRAALLATTALAIAGTAYGQTCTLGTLAYTASGSVPSLLMQGLNGQMDIMAWNEGAATSSVVNLPATYSTVQVFDPTISSTDPVQTLSNVNSVTLALTNHPLIVQLGTPIAGSAGSTAAPVQSQSVQTFVSSIGVNTHMAFGSGDSYSNTGQVLQMLNYLGINHVRDGAPNSSTLTAFEQAASAGVQFDLVTSPAGMDVAQTLPSDINTSAALAAAVPGSVVSIEGPNELNGAQVVDLNGATSTNAATGAAIVQTVSQAVRGNPTLAAQNVQVVNVSLNNGVANWQSYMAGLGNLDSSVSDGNWHVYFGGGVQPGAVIASMLPDAQASAPGKPVVITELGYPTDASSFGVSDATQADQILNALADASKDGVQSVDLYELMDDWSGNWGLFNSDGTPKTSATALRNMISILENDNGATSTQQGAYEQCAAPSTVTAPSAAIYQQAGVQPPASQAPASTTTTAAAPTVNTASTATPSIAQTAALATQQGTPPASTNIASTAQLATGADPGAAQTNAMAAADAAISAAANTAGPVIRTADSPSGTMPTPAAVSNSVTYSASGDFQTLIPSPGNGIGTVSGNNNVIAATGGIQTVTITGTGNQLVLGPYSDTVTVQGAGNTIDGGGGNDTIVLQYPAAPAAPAVLTVAAAALVPLANSGNIFVAPAPGTGVLTITGQLAAADRIDVTAAVVGLAGYTGSNVSRYLTQSTSAGGCTLSVQGTPIVILSNGCPTGSFITAEHG